MEFLEKARKRIYKLLRWSEQYTKTDMVYLAKGGSWLTLDTVATSAIAFGTALAFANFLPKDTYGTYKFVLSAAAILAIPTLQGMGTAVTRSIAQGYGGSLIKALKARLRWGILSTLASFGVSLYYFLNDNTELTLAFAIIAFLIPLKQSFSLYFSALNGKKDFKRNAQYDIAGRIFSGAFLVVTILLTGNLYLILLAYFVPWIIAHIFLFYRTTSKLNLSKRVDEALESYGKHLSAMGVISTVANHLDKILLFHYLGAAEVAVYSFAVAIPDQLKGIFKSLSNLALPQFSNRSIKSIQKKILQKMGVTLAVVLPLIGLYIIAAPYVYEIFFSKYLDSIFPSQLYAISLIGVAGLLPKSGLEAHEETKKLYYFNVAESVLGAAGMLIFIPQFGIIGAISVKVVVRVFNTLFLTFLFKK